MGHHVKRPRLTARIHPSAPSLLGGGVGRRVRVRPTPSHRDAVATLPGPFFFFCGSANERKVTSCYRALLRPFG